MLSALRAPSRRDWLIFFSMLVMVPLAGEPKIHPFTGDFASFRVSFGSPVFLLFLLWLQAFPRLFTGIMAGLAVMLFRTWLDVSFAGVPFSPALYSHIPNFFYYFFYAFFFALPKVETSSIYKLALIIAFWAVVAEVFASIAELAAMNMMAAGRHMEFTTGMLLRLIYIAVLRCFFILSFFFLFQLYTTEMRLDRKTKESRRLTLLISGLYEEVFQLKATFRHAEEATHDCYQVYKSISGESTSMTRQEAAQEILRVAGMVHDIKKETQRIYAALSELTVNKHVEDYLLPESILQLLIHTEEKYAERLGKDIHFSSQVSPLLPSLHVFTLLSLLGNLASNAVEAIKEQGLIIISFDEENDYLLLKVQNTGSFISPRRLSQVCRPGYTTKFDSQGRASSGVGLSYVQQQAASLGGTFTIESDGREWVACRLRLPLSALRQQPHPEVSPLPTLREAALRDAARAALEEEKEAHEKGDSL